MSDESEGDSEGEGDAEGNGVCVSDGDGVGVIEGDFRDKGEDKFAGNVRLTPARAISVERLKGSPRSRECDLEDAGGDGSRERVISAKAIRVSRVGSIGVDIVTYCGPYLSNSEASSGAIVCHGSSKMLVDTRAKGDDGVKLGVVSWKASVVDGVGESKSSVQSFGECTTVFVGNFPPSMSYIKLRDWFLKFGTVVDVFNPRKQSKINGSNFAFVRFLREIDARMACAKVHGSLCEGFRMEVNISRFPRVMSTNSSGWPISRSQGIWQNAQTTKPPRFMATSRRVHELSSSYAHVLISGGDTIRNLDVNTSLGKNSTGVGEGIGPFEENVGHFFAVFFRNSGVSSIGEKGEVYHPTYDLSEEELRGDGCKDLTCANASSNSGIHGSGLGINPDPLAAERISPDSARYVSNGGGSSGPILMVDYGCGVGNGYYSKGVAALNVVMDQSSHPVSKDADFGDAGGCEGYECPKNGINVSKSGVIVSKSHAGVVGSSVHQAVNGSSDGVVERSSSMTQFLKAPKGYHIIKKADCEAITNGMIDDVSEAFELGV